jgi:perosamine synthetase
MIEHNYPTLGLDEQRAATRVIGCGWCGPGKEVERFENELCRYLELPDGHAVAVSSGTAALFMAVKHFRKLNISYPIYTCSAVRNAIMATGSLPEPKDIGSDYDIVVHMFGIPEKVDSLDRPFIEDAAQAFGAKINNQYVGTFGDYGVFSFSATKIITTGGQGGAIVSRDKGRIDEIRDYREFDMRSDLLPRFNFQMSDLQAAIGRVQLTKINKFIQRREEIFNEYVLAGLPMFKSSDKSITDVRYRAVMKTDKARKIIDSMRKYGIKAIVPIEEFELLGDKELYPKALEMARKTVSLPIYPSMNNKEIDLIILVVKKCLC